MALAWRGGACLPPVCLLPSSRHTTVSPLLHTHPLCPQSVNHCPSRIREALDACRLAEQMDCAPLCIMLTYPTKSGDVAMSPGTSEGDGTALYGARRIFAAAAPVFVRDIAPQCQETGVGGARHQRGKPVHHEMDAQLAEVGRSGGVGGGRLPDVLSHTPVHSPWCAPAGFCAAGGCRVPALAPRVPRAACAWHDGGGSRRGLALGVQGSASCCRVAACCC